MDGWRGAVLFVIFEPARRSQKATRYCGAVHQKVRVNGFVIANDGGFGTVIGADAVESAAVGQIGFHHELRCVSPMHSDARIDDSDWDEP